MSKQHTTKKSVSFPQDLVEFAIAKAATERRSFSSYLQSLIEKERRGELEVKPAKVEEQPA